MSPTQLRARRPWARTCSAVLSTSRHPWRCSSSGNVAGSLPVPVTTTSAPIAASTIAVARPIPRSRPAPVTSATRPSNSPMRLSFLPPLEPVSSRSRQHQAPVARDSKHREYTRKKAECRRNCPALQGPWHWSDQEEAGTVAEKRKAPVALGYLSTLSPEQL